MDISAIVGILWRRKLAIAASTVAFLVIATGYLAVTKPTYTAEAVILVDPRETNATSSPNVLGGIGSDSAAIASQVSIITSIGSLRAVFDAENIVNDPEFTRPGLVSGLIQIVRGRKPAVPDEIFETFRKRVSVEREGLTYVLNVRFSSEDPNKAARIVNAIVERYISGQIAEKSGVSTEISGRLNDRIATLRQDVSTAEQAVEEFRAKHDIFDVGSGRTLLDTRIEQVNTQLIEAQEAAREAESRFQQATAIGTSPSGLSRLTEFLASGSAERLRDNYNDRLAELAQAKVEYGARHPSLIRLEAEIAHLKQLMRNEAERIIAELRATKELTTANVTRIESDLKTLRDQATQSNQLAVQLRQLERNADASRQVLEQFLARSEETSQLGQLQRSDARVVSGATPPVKPTWPRPSLLLGIAGAFGFLFGCGLALFLEAPALTASGGRRSVAPEPAAEPATDTALVAASHWQSMVNHGTVRTRYRRPMTGETNRLYLDRTRREVTDDPKGGFALQMRSLTYRLLGGIPLGKAPAVILYSAIGDRFEKDRLAYASATEMVKQGLHPLILDLDPLVRNGATAVDMFRIGPRGPGMIRRADDEPGFVVIAAGPEDNADGRFAELTLQKFGNTFDVIIIIGGAITNPREPSLVTLADHHVVVLSEGEDHDAARFILREYARLQKPNFDLVTVDYGAEDVAPEQAMRPTALEHPVQPQLAAC
ncbi:MAG: GumC family protein [Hyphomicrobiales bacterium]|nr:GumC family protein [Hyphomicrobiales bacterium]